MHLSVRGLLCLITGCAPMLGIPDVTFGDPQPLPLVQPSTDSRRWYVPMETGALGPVVWFVDTGYTYSTCDDGLSRALGLDRRGSVRIRGEMGVVRASKARLPPIELGGHRIDDLVCQIRDLGTTSSLDDPTEVPIAGVIGMDVLRQFRVVFDPLAGEMHLYDGRALEPLPATGEGIAQLRRSGVRGLRSRIALDVGDVRVWPVLDTGATSTYVDGERIGLEPSHSRDNVIVRGTGAAVHDVGVARTSLDLARAARADVRRANRATESDDERRRLREARDDVRVARHTVRDARSSSPPERRVVISYELTDVALAGMPAGEVTLIDRDRRWWEPGLLGLDVLSRFHQDYDFAHNRAQLTPTSAQPLRQFSTWWPPEEPLPSRMLDVPEDAVSDPE